MEKDKKIINSGVNFCQENKVKHIGHDKLVATIGNQKWHGGIPSFTINPNRINHDI